MLTKVGNGEKDKELEGHDIQGKDTIVAIFLTAGYAHYIYVSLGQRAAVHGVLKSPTGLSDFTFTHRRRKWQPTPVLSPGESQGQGSLVGFHLWDRTESDTTEAT